MPDPISVIVGLGNPGVRYAQTRHNAGFQFLSAISADLDARFVLEQRFHGMLAQGELQGMSVLLLAPETFMNRSGIAVASLMRFYKIPVEQLLVVHDELDLSPGTVRLKRGGGAGGHNGLRDIIERLGTREFARLRIGIGRPTHSYDVVDYVLHRPGPDEEPLIQEAIDQARAQLPLILKGRFELAMNALHSKPEAPEEPGGPQ